MRIVLTGFMTIVLVACGSSRPETPAEFYTECRDDYSPQYLSANQSIYQGYLDVGLDQWTQVTGILEQLKKRYGLFMIDGGTQANFGTDPYQDRSEGKLGFHAYFMWLCSSSGLQLNVRQVLNPIYVSASGSRLTSPELRTADDAPISQTPNKQKMKLTVYAYKNHSGWREFTQVLIQSLESAWPGGLEQRIQYASAKYNKSYYLAVSDSEKSEMKKGIEEFCRSLEFDVSTRVYDSSWSTFSINCRKSVSPILIKTLLTVSDHGPDQLYVRIGEETPDAAKNPQALTSQFKKNFVTGQNKQWREHKPDQRRQSKNNNHKGSVAYFLSTLKFYGLIVLLKLVQIISTIV